MLRWSIWLGPVICLLVAFLDMPYGYYQLLRIVVFCASAYFAFAEGKNDSGFWFWAFIASALTYNPLVKLSLGKDIWPVVNVSTIAFFVAHFFVRQKMLASR